MENKKCYEKSIGQQVEIVCEEKQLLDKVIEAAEKIDGTEACH